MVGKEERIPYALRTIRLQDDVRSAHGFTVHFSLHKWGKINELFSFFVFFIYLLDFMCVQFSLTESNVSAYLDFDFVCADHIK